MIKIIQIFKKIPDCIIKLSGNFGRGCKLRW